MIKLKDFIPNKLKEGIRQSEDGSFEFDWNNDLVGDIIPLTKINTKFSKLYKKIKKITIYWSYKFLTASKYSLESGKSKEEIKNSIDQCRRELKNLNDPNIIENVSKMVNVSLNEFEKSYPITSFDVIVYPVSSGKMNDLIISELKKRTDKPLVTLSFVKNITKYIKLDDDLLSKSKSEKTKNLVPLVYKALMKNPEKIYAVKNVRASLRRYFHNFLRWENDIESIKLVSSLKSGKILIVDDTIGEGATLKEMLKQIISINTESEIVAYIPFKDY